MSDKFIIFLFIYFSRLF